MNALPHDHSAKKKSLRSALGQLQAFLGMSKRTEKKVPTKKAGPVSRKSPEPPHIEVVQVPAIVQPEPLPSDVEDEEIEEIMAQEEPTVIDQHDRTHILDGLPEGKNLVNAAPITITLDHQTHVLAFRSEAIILDGVNYSFTIDDEPLDIIEAARNGTSILMKTTSDAIRTHGPVLIDMTDARLCETLLILLKRGTTIVKVGQHDIMISRF